MKIVTGYTGMPHITSNAMQGFNQGIFGNKSYILKVGNQLWPTLIDANHVSVADGEGIMQGVHFRIDPGTSETVDIESGTTGYKRIDLICARYTKDVLTGIEDVSLVVVKGTPDASTPSEPTYNEGDILAGDTLVDFPLFKVTLNGVSPTLWNYADYAPTLGFDLVPVNMRTSTYSALTGTSGFITFPASGWYALTLVPSGDDTLQSANKNVYLRGTTTQGVANLLVGHIMTPWFYMPEGAEYGYSTDSGSTVYLMQAKSML